MQYWYIIPCLILIGLLAWGISYVLRRQRHHVWQQLAKRWRCQLVETPDEWTMSGEREGRAIRMTTQTDRSDDDEGGIAEVLIGVALRGLPTDFKADATPGVIGAVAKSMEEEQHEIGSPEFDQDVSTSSPDPQFAEKYWTPSRRQVFLNLIETAPCDRISVHQSELEGEFRSVVSDIDQIEEIFRHLLDAAPKLDGDAESD